MSAYGEPPVPISLVAHWIFCPRRAWLEAAGERTDTGQMAVGVSSHKRTDDAATARPKQERAVNVGHRDWGVSGRVDTLEHTEGGWLLREYKATPVRRAAEVTDAMRIQLALQAACLTDSGYEVSGTEVYFTTHNRRVPVELDAKDFADAEAAVAATRSVVNAENAPVPLEDSPKCLGCSHASICLPDERKLALVSRRIVATAPETQIVHLTTPGARASVRSGRLIVKKQGEQLGDVPLERVLGVQVHGNVDMSGALIRELLWRRATIVWSSGIGRVVGWANSGSSPNGQHRVAQHVASAEGRLGFAREFLSAKVANQGTLLRRSAGNSSIIQRLREVQSAIKNGDSWPEIVGLEGEAAARYFAAWPACFKTNIVDEWGWKGRGSRPARDPINAMLNYGYGMLISDCIRALVSCGLDPHAGFVHSSNRNKPALALDLMEEFRAPIVDSVIMNAVNNREVKPTDFDNRLGSSRLKERARRALVAGYERRVQTEFRHPLFQYSVTWRRAIEIQARQVLGVLDGTQPRYEGIRTR